MHACIDFFFILLNGGIDEPSGKKGKVNENNK